MLCALIGALPAVPGARADEAAAKKLTAEERKELEAKWKESALAAIKAQRAGQLPEAAKAIRDAIEVARRLYPKDEFPDGHEDLANGLNNLGTVYRDLGKLEDAEPPLNEALEMYKRLFKGDHPTVANCSANLAQLSHLQRKYADAERLYRDSLEMYKRLFKGDHPSVAHCLNDLGALYWTQGKYADAEPLIKETLEMYKRLFKKGDHPRRRLQPEQPGDSVLDSGKVRGRRAALQGRPGDEQATVQGRPPHRGQQSEQLGGPVPVPGKAGRRRAAPQGGPMYKRAVQGQTTPEELATALNNLEATAPGSGQASTRTPSGSTRRALEMNKRLHRGDHPELAMSLNSLGFLYLSQGKLSDAEPLYKDALEMRNRLFKGDHPALAQSLENLGALYDDQGKYTEAEALLKDALEMKKRLH